MDLTLYEFGPTRSVRCRWILQELELPFKSIEDRALVGSDELRKLHPLAKMPVLIADGKPLFESAAICSWLADGQPEKKLIEPVGSWDRGLHDQWVSFAQSELEAYLWSNACNTTLLPEDQRVSEILEQNNAMARKAAVALDAALSADDYLVAGRFTVTDIIVGFTLNWARRAGHLDGLNHVQSYLKRLFARPHCPLNAE